MPGTTSAALPSFSHDQHHETDEAKRKRGPSPIGLEPVDGEEPLTSVTVASATPDLRLPSQLQGITAHWLVPNYAAW